MIKWLILLILSTNVQAACVYRTDIVRQGDRFSYSEGCHTEFGTVLKKHKNLKKQIKSYKELLSVGEKQLDLEQEKSELLEEALEESSDEYEKAIDSESNLKYYYFVGGILSTILINKGMN